MVSRAPDANFNSRSADTSSTPITLTSRVRGRVQGVGFRFYALREARRLGLGGWVRNEPDGSVSVLYEGTRKQAQAMRIWLEHGPPSARVTHIETVENPYTNRYGNTFCVQ